jgi:outer membrane receptor protein involved in Fe transport
MSFHSRPTLVVLLVLLCLADTLAYAQEPLSQGTTSSTATSYPAAFFAGSRTYSALDMLELLPGYTFIDSDTDVRGYGSAVGNVLIDGNRPASKYESLEAILRRIPTSNVERIELIRAGAPGMDMQGYAVLANVIRTDDLMTRGSLEAGNAFYERGLDAPRIAGDMARRSGERLIELSASFDQAIEDESGAGNRVRLSPQGELLRDGNEAEDEAEKVAAVAASYENAVFDGKLRLHGSLHQNRLRTDLREEVTFPAARSSVGNEFNDATSSELGMQFARDFASASELELLVIRRDEQARGGERSVSMDESSFFGDETTASESILRTLVRHQQGARSLQGGVEMALNTLDSRGSLVENDAIVEIPNSDVQVEERRGEAFVVGKWKLSTTWHLELAARFEYSELTQSGDSTLSKSFFFPKPRALLTWSREQNQIRFLVERDVGQLEFADFASSASLATGTVTAGNQDLEPERTWRAEISWERRFLDAGALSIAVRHEEIEDIIDRMPVVADTVFDAIGNIGAGVRDELEIDLTLPLDAIGVSSGVLKATALWRRGETRDPVTRQSRPISEDEPFEAVVHFLQALPPWKARWGIDLTLAELVRQYYFDEVRVDREGAMLDVFLEFEPAPSWNVRLFANNLTDRESEQRRELYGGMRSDAVLRHIDTRTLGIGPHVGILVRRSFGD